jgi:aryl-alcohol dehydrogenase-like predicted oxidoreductase
MVPRRAYRPGVELSVLGLGGLAVSRTDQATADRLVAEFVECGGNYFDVAPTYHDAEDRLGPALAPYRQGVFLACKTIQRTAEGARRELESSLKKLGTDHFDLYQLHGLGSMEEAQQVLAPGGAVEALLAARQAGKVRFLGFSAHSPEAAVHLMRSVPCDSVVFPVNFLRQSRANAAQPFAQTVLEEAARLGVSCIAIKGMALREARKGESPVKNCWYIPLAAPRAISLALRWTLAQGVVAALPPGNTDVCRLAIAAATQADVTRPLTKAEYQELLSYAQGSEPLFAE